MTMRFGSFRLSARAQAATGAAVARRARRASTGRRLAALVVAVATAGACSDSDGVRRGGRARTPVGPPVACTLIGCDDGLTIALDPPSGWPQGRYRFDVEADGARASCTGSLPLPSCASQAIACDGADLVRIVESGCALPAGSQAFPEIRFDSRLRPERVRVTVSRNGGVVGEAEIRPQFRASQPNGPDCPPVCHMARATIALRF